LNEIEILRAPDGALVRELSLVLNSVGIPHRVVGNQHQQWILAPEEHAREALEELSNYHRENLRRRQQEVPLPTRSGWQTQALGWAVLLCAFHVLTEAGAFGFDWRRVGAVDGALIREGQWWRATTALFLHGNLQHIASNLAFGALFVVLLYQVLGTTWTWTSILVGASLANLLNAWISGPDLRSLGASTAVFAALGSLTAVQWSRKLASGRDKAKRWVPLLGGILLLGWNGMGGARYDPWSGLQRPADNNTDVGAHLAGFVCGLAVGFALWRVREQGKLTPTMERWAAILTPSVALLAWGLALLVS
jgi:rhomboid protease GluP